MPSHALDFQSHYIPCFNHRSCIPRDVFSCPWPFQTEYLVFLASSIIHTSLGCTFLFSISVPSHCPFHWSFIYSWMFSLIAGDLNLSNSEYLVFPALSIAHASLGCSLMPLAISIYLSRNTLFSPLHRSLIHFLDTMSLPSSTYPTVNTLYSPVHQSFTSLGCPRFSISHLRLIPDMITSCPRLQNKKLRSNIQHPLSLMLPWLSCPRL